MKERSSWDSPITRELEEEYIRLVTDSKTEAELRKYYFTHQLRQLQHKPTSDVFEEIENSEFSSLLLRDVSVSSHTHRYQDLIRRYLDVLRQHDTDWYCAHLLRPFPMPPAYAYEDDDDPWWESDQCQTFMDELNERMDELAPEGYYFGAHPGDGSDFGFWRCEEEGCWE